MNQAEPLSNQTFLQEVADLLVDSHGHELENIVIVVPGHRPGIFLKKFLAQKLARPFWAPQILEITEFFSAVGKGRHPADSIDLLFKLFETYNNCGFQDPVDLNGFFSWGLTALSDFSDIDNYMLDSKQVFRDLKNLKELEEWSFNLEELTTEQSRFLQFWDDLGKLYHEFRANCEDTEILYPGLFKNSVVKEDQIETFPEWKHIYFVGFNALSRTETSLLKHFTSTGRATLLWDYDRFYVEHKWHEAGHFARVNAKSFNGLGTTPDFLESTPPRFEFHEASTFIGQALIAGNIVGELSEKQLENTAIILADESLLIPLLSSLPKDIPPFNITLGYPFILSDVYHLLFGLLSAARESELNNSAVSHKLLNSILNNPLFSSIDSEEHMTAINHVKKTIIKENQAFPNANNWKAFAGDDLFLQSFKWVFSAPEAWSEIGSHLQNTIAFLASHSEDRWSKEFLHHSSQIITRISDIARKYDFTKGVSTYAEVFDKYSRQETVSFIGEPLSGLQIMGMLESRALDFETVIIVGANEGTLPSATPKQSFIPYELRQMVGLPGQKEKDAIFAYYFYRLVQRAKDAHVIYTAQKDVFGSGERSRYLTQIERDIIGHRQKSISWTSGMTGPHSSNIRIPSNEDIRNRIRQRLEKGISPSALNTFISCPLDFYYRYVMGFSEPDEMEERIHVSTFGTIVHEVLEKFFGDVEDQILTQGKVESWFPEIEKETSLAFDKKYARNKHVDGINHIAWHVARIYAKRMLEMEISTLKSHNLEGKHLVIKGVELGMNTQLKLSIYGELLPVKLRGFIDRVDMLGESLRVVDYKSGAVDQKDLQVADLTTDLVSGKKPKALQLLTYARIYFGETGIVPDRAGIVSMRKISNGMMYASVGGEDQLTSETMKSFDEGLSRIIELMLDKDLMFEHNTDARFCSFCGQ
jgi:CRISPR/Cas system-associated exonuclease Cas4 (RecB family)